MKRIYIKFSRMGNTKIAMLPNSEGVEAVMSYLMSYGADNRGYTLYYPNKSYKDRFVAVEIVHGKWRAFSEPTVWYGADGSIVNDYQI
jgi:predicted nucleotide-binding protein (sugar kinase/HSP70/actin superfamily)